MVSHASALQRCCVASADTAHSGAFEECKVYLHVQLKVYKQVNVQAATLSLVHQRCSNQGITHTIKQLGHIMQNGTTPGSKRKQKREWEASGATRIEWCFSVCMFAAADVAGKVTDKLQKQPLQWRACKLCSINTAMFCTGCNQHLCVNKGRMETLTKRVHYQRQCQENSHQSTGAQHSKGEAK